MISFRNAITPTELGDFLLQAFHDFSVPVQDAQRIIRSESREILEHANKDFLAETKLFKSITKQALSENKNQILRFSRDLKAITELNLHKNLNRIENLASALTNTAKYFSQRQQERISQLKERISPLFMNQMNEQKRAIANLENQVRILDPMNTLKRGYSIDTYNGKTIIKQNQPVVGDQIEVKTFRHFLTSEIKSITFFRIMDDVELVHQNAW